MTPNYKGTKQPAASGGGWLSSWAGAAPVYKTAHKRTDTSTSGSEMAPKPSPAPQGDASVAPCREHLDPCACGPIAIVIPRDADECSQ
ncbi:MAG: hypothetical protein KF773_12445 [Deltaproteobacteria bacterium]|nr:hypothetical protein [Deltaproteobacteria bacterium]